MSEASENLSFYPIKYPSLIQHLKRQQSVYWLPSAVPLSDDRRDWDSLDSDTQTFLKFWLAFFSQADGIICENLMNHFQKDTAFIKEAGYFYSIQNAMEVIHNEMYSLMIETVIRDMEEKNRLFDAIHNYPEIEEITRWTIKWMNSDIPLQERIIAFACVEGIFFTGAFAAVYWIKQHNKLKGICVANEWIARDERLHTEFAFDLYDVLTKPKPNGEGYDQISPEKIQEIISSAMDTVEVFIRKALRVELIGINADDMVNYVKCTADAVAEGFGAPKIYNATNPFIWMVNIGLPNKSNFFEKRTTEYARCQTTVDFNMDSSILDR
jgi:ribonucleoside-diphosphate reductase subunit M2